MMRWRLECHLQGVFTSIKHGVPEAMRLGGKRLLVNAERGLEAGEGGSHSIPMTMCESLIAAIA